MKCWLPMLALLAGCARGGLAETLAEPPAPWLPGASRCALMPSQMRPLVVEWPAADRGSLEVQLRRGPVVVRYEGCELEVLHGCSVAGRYMYAGFTRKHDSVTILDEDELYAQMPLGADKLAGRLARSGALHVELDYVGQYVADRASFTRWDLEGQCRGASHVLAAAQVGAFAVAATSQAVTGVAAAERSASFELIDFDGDADACTAAQPSDTEAPARCSALLRLEFTPLLGDAGHGSGFDAPLTRKARAQGYASPNYRAARRWTIFGGTLVGLAGAGVGMIVGGFASKVPLHRQADALDRAAPGHHAQLEALRARDLQVTAVGFIGVGLAAVLPVFGGLALDYGLSMMRVERVRSLSWRVAPSVGRTHGGLQLTLNF